MGGSLNVILSFFPIPQAFLFEIHLLQLSFPAFSCHFWAMYPSCFLFWPPLILWVLRIWSCQPDLDEKSLCCGFHNAGYYPQFFPPLHIPQHASRRQKWTTSPPSGDNAANRLSGSSARRQLTRTGKWWLASREGKCLQMFCAGRTSSRGFGGEPGDKAATITTSLTPSLLPHHRSPWCLLPPPLHTMRQKLDQRQVLTLRSKPLRAAHNQSPQKRPPIPSQTTPPFIFPPKGFPFPPSLSLLFTTLAENSRRKWNITEED